MMTVTVRTFANAAAPVYVCRHRDGRVKTLTGSEARAILDAHPEAAGSETYDALAFAGYCASRR